MYDKIHELYDHDSLRAYTRDWKINIVMKIFFSSHISKASLKLSDKYLSFIFLTEWKIFAFINQMPCLCLKFKITIRDVIS